MGRIYNEGTGKVPGRKYEHDTPSVTHTITLVVQAGSVLH